MINNWDRFAKHLVAKRLYIVFFLINDLLQRIRPPHWLRYFAVAYQSLSKRFEHCWSVLGFAFCGSSLVLFFWNRDWRPESKVAVGSIGYNLGRSFILLSILEKLERTRRLTLSKFQKKLGKTLLVGQPLAGVLVAKLFGLVDFLSAIYSTSIWDTIELVGFCWGRRMVDWFYFRSRRWLATHSFQGQS